VSLSEQQLWDWYTDPVLAYHMYVSKKIPVEEPAEEQVMRSILVDRVVSDADPCDFYLAIDAPDRRAKAWKDGVAEAASRGVVALLAHHARGLEASVTAIKQSRVYTDMGGGAQAAEAEIDDVTVLMPPPVRVARRGNRVVGLLLRATKELSPTSQMAHQRLAKYRYLSELTARAYGLDDVLTLLAAWDDPVSRLCLYCYTADPSVDLRLGNITAVSKNVELAAGGPVVLEVDLSCPTSCCRTS
jgi:hypothetical protein